MILNRRKGLLLVGLGLAFMLAVLFVSCRAGRGGENGGDGSGSSPDPDESYEIEQKPTVNVDYPDTLFGTADVTGKWENRYDTSSTIEFADGGRYLVNGNEMGTWTPGDGYVMINDRYGSSYYYRLRRDSGGGLGTLVTDYSGLDEEYRRCEGRPADVLTDPDGNPIDEERLWRLTDTVLQILRKSAWYSSDDAVSRAFFGEQTVDVYAEDGGMSQYTYQVTSVGDHEGGYSVLLRMDGNECRMELTEEGLHGSAGYKLELTGADSLRLNLVSYREIELCEPE